MFPIHKEEKNNYAKNKISKYHFYSPYGILHGLLHDGLQHRPEIRRFKQPGFLISPEGNVAGVRGGVLPDLLCDHWC